MYNFKMLSTIACVLVLFTLLCPSKTVTAARMNAKRFRGQGGWTLNSVGYNGGLGALRKLLAKRSDIDEPDDTQYSDELDVEFDPDNLVNDFMQFLQMRESGLLGHKMLQCILERPEEQPVGNM